jgi:Zn finger protein HypA/HybF involved in hydrogenase expression
MSQKSVAEAIDIQAIDSLSFWEKGGEQMQAYCMKCRAKKEMKNPKGITMKNRRPATQGVCPTCGTKMFRIGKG